ncbi:hypothetical protein AAHC03_017235 [Spirometra sp. Aus1]
MEVRVEYDYNAEERDELTIKQGDIITNVSQFEEGWFIGTLNGKEGVFPDNFVKIIKAGSPKPDKTSPRTPAAKALPPSDAAPKGEWVKVMFQYTPEQPDELELQVGEIIQVLDRNLSEEGWWRGQNVKTKKTGVFPDNFVELIDPNKPEVQKLLSEAQNSSPGNVARSNDTPAARAGHTGRPSTVNNAWNRSTGDPYFAKGSGGAGGTALDSAGRTGDHGMSKKLSGETVDASPASTDRGRQGSKRATGRPAGNATSGGPGQRTDATNKQAATLSPTTVRKAQGRTEPEAASTPIKAASTTPSNRIRGSSVSRVDNLRTNEVGSKQVHDLQQTMREQEEQLRAYSVQLSQLTSAMDRLKKENKDKLEGFFADFGRQIESVKESQGNLKAEFARGHNALVDRMHTLMQELDEVKKARAADAVELGRIRKVIMQIDSKVLSGEPIAMTAAGEVPQSRTNSALPYVQEGDDRAYHTNFAYNGPTPPRK